MQQCRNCKNSFKTKCLECDVPICSEMCLQDHIKLQDIGFTHFQDNMVEGARVMVNMTGLLEDFRGAWLEGYILETEGQWGTRIKVYLVKIDLQNTTIWVERDRVQPYRGPTLNHDWQLGDKAHALRIKDGTEVWWEAEIIHPKPNDEVWLKYRYLYEGERQKNAVPIANLRLADMNDFRPVE